MRAWAECGRGQSAGVGEMGAWGRGRSASVGGVGPWAEWGCGSSGGVVGGVGGEKDREKWRKGGMGVGGEKRGKNEGRGCGGRNRREINWPEGVLREKLGGGSVEGVFVDFE